MGSDGPTSSERVARAHRRPEGRFVHVEAKPRRAERELGAGAQLDLDDAVWTHPRAVGASGVAHVDAIAVAA
jgi:hypothetical protein